MHLYRVSLIPRFTSSFIAPIFLAHFIRLRYHASPFSRHAVNAVTARIDSLAGNQGGVVANGWAAIKRAVGSWGGGRLVPQQPGQPGGPQAQGQAQAQARLGTMVFNGDGVAANPEEGLMWLTVASRRVAGTTDESWVNELLQNAMSVASPEERKKGTELADTLGPRFGGL